MLFLFDIDATLLVTSRSGLYAMQDAGVELFGRAFSFEGVDFAGRLDPLILRELFAKNGVEASKDNFAAMRRVYHGKMVERLAVPGVARALPGVLELIAALAARDDATLGILTGNFEEVGLLKLRAVGLDPDQFPIRVWGDGSPHEPPTRDHLVPVAFARLATHAAAPRERARSGGLDRLLLPAGVVDPRRVVVIGDTPHDVGCARAHGCRSVGVATGVHTRAMLDQAGADVSLDSLADTPRVVSILYGS